MENVTVALPENTALWLQAREDSYEAAMARALARKPRKMTWVDGRKPTRDELHDRTGLRLSRQAR